MRAVLGNVAPPKMQLCSDDIIKSSTRSCIWSDSSIRREGTSELFPLCYRPASIRLEAKAGLAVDR